MYKKLIKCILLLIFFIFVDLLIKSYFTPFFSIVILLLLSTPIYKLLCRQSLLSSKVNAIITIITVNVIVFFAIIYSGSILFIKIKYLISAFFSQVTIQQIDKHLPIVQYFKIEDIAKNIKNYVFDSLNFNIMQKGAFFTTDFLISYFVGNISVYFILVDYCDIVKYIKSYVSDKKLELIRKKSKEVKNIVLIEIILVLVTTLQTICGFVILEVDSAVFLGILCGFLDILPYVGTLLIFLPLVIYKIYQTKYIISVGLIFLYILLQFNRQIMETKFMSINLQIHPLALLISIYVGSKIFGMVGLIMGPIYLIIVKEIIISQVS